LEDTVTKSHTYTTLSRAACLTLWSTANFTHSNAVGRQIKKRQSGQTSKACNV